MRNSPIKLVIVSTFLIFSLGACCYANSSPPKETDTLGIYNIFQTPSGPKDIRFTTGALKITEELLLIRTKEANLKKTIRDQFRNDQDILNAITFSKVSIEKNFISFSYTRYDGEYLVNICLSKDLVSIKQDGENWITTGRFAIHSQLLPPVKLASPENSVPEEAYVFDYDGTLAERNQNISDKMVKRLARILLHGKSVAVLSGKPVEEIHQYGITISKNMKNALSNYGIPGKELHSYLNNLSFYMSGGAIRYIVNNENEFEEDPDYPISFPENYFGPDGAITKHIGTASKSYVKGALIPSLAKYTNQEEYNKKAFLESRLTNNGRIVGLSLRKIKPLGFNGADYRESIASQLRVNLSKNLYIDPAGKTSIDITLVQKSYAIKDLFKRGHKRVFYFGDEPEGNDKSVKVMSSNAAYVIKNRKLSFVDIKVNGKTQRENVKKTERLLDVFLSRFSEEEKMDKIHKTNMSLLPPVAQDTTLVHLISTDLIPKVSRNDFMNVVRDMNDIYQKEKIVVITDGQKHHLTPFLVSLSHKYGTKINVTAAFSSKDDIKLLPENIKKALVFEGELSDFRQLEGIFAALRALHQNNTQALLELYSILANEPFTAFSEDDILACINDPEELAKKLTFFIAPPDKYDTEIFRDLHKKMLNFIQAA